MLWTAAKVKGYAIDASDGTLGTVSDFLFDDANWAIRWLVVDTGHWLPGRKLLLPVCALGRPDREKETISVHLTRRQVENSPDIEAHQPVSRQMETGIFDYYGWSPYWGNGYCSSGFGPMYGQAVMPLVPGLGERRDTVRRQGDPHLRSIREVTDYHVHACDGDIGHVSDFLVGDTDWSIHFLVVNTSDWWMGKTVIVSPRWACKVDWIAREVSLTVDRDSVRNSPDYSDETMIDPGYEQDVHRHYGSRRDVAGPDHAGAQEHRRA